MPVADPTSGRIFIWLIACLLFTSVALGGSFLILYITLPENVSKPWLPIAGVALVCLPWVFWCFTCFYRIISRMLGFRFVLGSEGGRGNSNAVLPNSHNRSQEQESTVECVEEGDRDGGGRQVQFSGSMVIGENNNGEDGDKKKANMRSLSSVSYNNLSFASHDSETPLTSSMSS